MTEPDAIEQAIRAALSPKHGMTCLEVMARCPKGLAYAVIHKRLNELVKSGDIKTEVTGERPVREYRAWK